MNEAYKTLTSAKMTSSSSTHTTCFVVVLMLWSILQYATKTAYCATTDFNAIVAEDDIGDFTTVSEALKAAPKNNETRYVT
ncbi:hypothetical protein L484_015494 [Morus notabilis]|uniref:Pectinesterase n=1 Tax=Morus notabilis TaxID=981085 RepID=W9RUJ0_9ROSA|nr:hypothetical protein L484_015494 [Morus notabilis]